MAGCVAILNIFAPRWPEMSISRTPNARPVRQSALTGPRFNSSGHLCRCGLTVSGRLVRVQVHPKPRQAARFCHSNPQGLDWLSEVQQETWKAAAVVLDETNYTCM